MVVFLFEQTVYSSMLEELLMQPVLGKHLIARNIRVGKNLKVANCIRASIKMPMSLLANMSSSLVAGYRLCNCLERYLKLLKPHGSLGDLQTFVIMNFRQNTVGKLLRW